MLTASLKLGRARYCWNVVRKVLGNRVVVSDGFCIPSVCLLKFYGRTGTASHRPYKELSFSHLQSSPITPNPKHSTPLYPPHNTNLPQAPVPPGPTPLTSPATTSQAPATASGSPRPYPAAMTTQNSPPAFLVGGRPLTLDYSLRHRMGIG